MLYILLLFFTILPYSQSWGRLGHAVTIKLAFRHFSQRTKDQLQKLHLSESQFVELSAWPDRVRNSHDAKKWGWTTKLHYVNIQSKQRIHRYDPVRDSLPHPCIVDSIDYYSCALTDEEERIMKSQEALSFLAHNLADLHQPLHVCEKDWVGLKRNFNFGKKKVSIHAAWDNFIVQHQVSKKRTVDEYVDYLEQLIPIIDRPYANMIHRHPSSYLDVAVQWANETAQLNHIVWDVDSTDLQDEYSDRVGDVVALQLARAGIRISAVMNSLFENGHVYQGPFIQTQSIYPAFTQKALLALEDTQKAKESVQTQSCLFSNNRK